MEPTSLQLVDQVLAGYPDWKRPVRALEQLPPDAASVRLASGWRSQAHRCRA